MDRELEDLEDEIIHEIEETEEKIKNTITREKADKYMPKIDALNWMLDEIFVLERED